MSKGSPRGNGSRIARNAIWNLLGAALPVPVALVCIPLLINGLGVDRFGVLGVAWMVLGYFGMFDFGLGLTTTRFVAAHVAAGEHDALRRVVANSLVLHAGFGIAGGSIFALLTPWLAQSVFAIPGSLVGETTASLYLLAASVPAIVITAALRGTLEGMQRFATVNLIRIPAGIANYAGPAIALVFGSGLPLVVAVIVTLRYIVAAAYAFACAHALPPGESARAFDRSLLARLTAFGGWLTVSNLLTPLIMATDRFVIAAAVSVAAVAYYVTPYEIITRTWMLSASLMAAVFPVMSGLAARDPPALRAVCATTVRHLLCLVLPIVAVVLGGGDLLLGWWLGPAFQQDSTTVAHLLSLGILINVLAQVPLTALVAADRADIPAGIAAAELPLYAVAVWYCAGRYGIDGVAAVWAGRAGVDALAMFGALNLVAPRAAGVSDNPATITRGLMLVAFLAAFTLTGNVSGGSVPARCILLVVVLAGLAWWEWRVLLDEGDRRKLAQVAAGLVGRATAR